jgi:hypothetical protein
MFFHIFSPYSWNDPLTYSTSQVYDRNTTYLAGVTGNTIPAVFTTTSRTVDLVFGAFATNKPNSATYNWQATYTAV